MKEWFRGIIDSSHGENGVSEEIDVPGADAVEILVAFANQHELGPGEIVVCNYIESTPLGGTDYIEFMYYAEHKLQ